MFGNTVSGVDAYDSELDTAKVEELPSKSPWGLLQAAVGARHPKISAILALNTKLAPSFTKQRNLPHAESPHIERHGDQEEAGAHDVRAPGVHA